MNLIEKIDSKQAIVSVVGLGYVGLPLAVAFTEAGFCVIGVDTDQNRVSAVRQGESYLQDVPSQRLKPLVSKTESEWREVAMGPCVSTSRLAKMWATTESTALSTADVVVVCVPTPLDATRNPDVSFIVSAAGDISANLHRGMLIVLESTTYPGTTEEIVLPQLQNSRGTKFEVGKDFFLAFSPERIDPGRTDWTVSNIPKVIGGVTERCTEAAIALYRCIVKQVMAVSSPKTAEMVKLLENTFRATNIGLINETAMICDKLEIDIWEVIAAAQTKPFGYMPFFPGPGLGGHCIPVDPQFLAWKLRSMNYEAKFIQLADEINSGMPAYWVSKVVEALDNKAIPVDGADILVIGVSYKRDIDDTRESPALDIIDLLLRKSARVSYYDPHVPKAIVNSRQLKSLSESEWQRRLEAADCVLIATDHSVFDWRQIKDSASIIVDTRNALGNLDKKISPAVNAIDSEA